MINCFREVSISLNVKFRLNYLPSRNTKNIKKKGLVRRVVRCIDGVTVFLVQFLNIYKPVISPGLIKSSAITSINLFFIRKRYKQKKQIASDPESNICFGAK